MLLETSPIKGQEYIYIFVATKEHDKIRGIKSGGKGGSECLCRYMVAKGEENAMLRSGTVEGEMAPHMQANSERVLIFLGVICLELV